MNGGVSNPKLRQLTNLPDGLIGATAQELCHILPEPTLIHLPGHRPQPLFVTVLQHGHETTGWLALQALLEKYQSSSFPRALSIFFGNVKAAHLGVRRLENQVDYNRVWPGTDLADCPEAAWCAEIVEAMAKREVFASIDVHNNTGTNPHYACINRLEPRFLQLASLFGRLVIYFTYPKGTQAAAFAPLCPAVTLECGKPDQEYGVQHALDYLDTCLHLEQISGQPVPARDLDLYASVAQVTIDPEVAFSFAPDCPDLLLEADIDRLNFTEIGAGTALGTIGPDCRQTIPLVARNPSGLDVTERYFARSGDRLVTTQAVMPSMLTLDERIIRQDCLCYLMERI